MGTLVLDRRSVSLDAKAGEFHLTFANGERQRFPAALLERVVVRGDSTLTSRSLSELWNHGIALLVLSGRRFAPTARMPVPGPRDAGARLAQAVTAHDADARVSFSIPLVRAKLQACLRTLAALNDDLHASTDAAKARRALGQHVAQLDAAPPRDVQTLRGIEGAAAALYFEALTTLVPSSLSFCGRNRRPPPDPLNATLSLTYTLLTFDAVRESSLCGLDPMIGFYHGLQHGRDSLACDLIEPLRPRADAWAIQLFRARKLRTQDFRYNKQACFLGKAGRSRFFEAYEDFVASKRRWLRHQARSLQNTLRRHHAPEVDPCDPSTSKHDGIEP